MEQIIDQVDEQFTSDIVPQLQITSLSKEIESYQGLTHINQLIAEIEPSSNYNYQSYVNMFKSMFELTRHLFNRQNNKKSEAEQDSFDDYINVLAGFKTGRKEMYFQEDQVQTLDSEQNKQQLRKSKKMIQPKQSKYPKKGCIKGSQDDQLQLIRCYQKVPYIYFQQKFVLNFGLFQRQSYFQSADAAIQNLNQHLDLVQLNLFSQIHRKFHQYFKVVANLDYLQQSITKNIIKVKEIRQIVQKNKRQYVEQTMILRKKIIHRQNIQKVVKMLKVIKSLNKLPTIVDTILKSSLPYQCLSLLQKTKQSLKSVEGLKCLTKIQQMLRNCQGTIQMSLSRRYTDELYLYLLADCQHINFTEKWSRIKYTVQSQNQETQQSILANTTNNNSIILDQSFHDDNPFNNRNFVLKRQQGKQYEISMIILESYRYIDFSIEQGRVKISNFLKLFFKIYENELGKYLKKVIQSSKTQTPNDSILSGIDKESNEKKIESEGTISKHLQQGNQQQNQLNERIVNNLSVEYYIRHIKVLNEVFGQVINRYMGFVYTLVNYYQKKMKATMEIIDGKKNSVNIQEFAKERQKFKKIFEQEFTLLPILYKMITEKVKSLLVLRNLNGVPYQDFYKWMSVLQYWLKSIDNIIEDHPLASYDGQLSQIIDNTFRKILTIGKQLNTTLKELTTSYIQIYHENALYMELKPTMEQDSWQSVQIPKQFEDLLSRIILGKQRQSNNMSVELSILNDSNYKPLRILQQDNKTSQGNIENTLKINIKVLKNTLIIEGVKYKVSVSLLFLCQIIDEYMKIGRLFCIDKKILFEKLFELIKYYNKMTQQLILGSKALTFQKIKTKSINARHICLLSNCLAVVRIIILEIPEFQQAASLAESIQSHRQELHKKLSTLLYKKVQSTIATQLQNQASGTMLQSAIYSANKTLMTAFLQMFEIVDDNLDSEFCKLIFRESLQLFMQKYFVYLVELSADQQSQCKIQVNQIRIFLEKLKFMEHHFKGQFEAMEKQLQI